MLALSLFCVLAVPIGIFAVPTPVPEDAFSLAKRAVCGSTAGINPLPIHSHNDYTRNVALCDALANSASSIEADLWWRDNTLFVAHFEFERDSRRTLQSLYVEPLLALLNAANPGGVKPGVRPKGLWPSSPNTALQLLIEPKSDGNAAFPAIVAALKPLADAGYLTSFSNGVLTPSAITVVGTGNTPLARVQSQNPRTFFFDAPLTALAPGSNTHFTSTLSPLASADYMSVVGWLGIGSLSADKKATIRRLVGDAHARGIKVRFWGSPGRILGINGPMKAVWKELLDAGVDWMNVDNLTTARDYYLDYKK
ncbi:unnamed protein product [Cyclocybe aegerita]|uniref:Altered inheritance of mitochondria protein 6 n=1 Tax=Cyclocybe aegerita TaxID=1973307 RepID=A0A8S0WDZ3_CYCAE|nr:unnamed protein product [Cyclocybe aegerita]